MPSNSVLHTFHKMKSFFNFIYKSLKFFLWTVLAILIIVNLLILLSGKLYIYKGVRHTYLVGKMGPGIYDLAIFPKTTISKASKKSILIIPSDYNSFKLSINDSKLMKDMETKAFLVLRGDTVLFEKYFSEHTQQTISNSFSAAKTVVALLVGIAVEEGKIKSLDEPVGNYITEFKSGGKEKITIRHLLMMSSGLDWEESASNPLSENAESYYGWNLRGLVVNQNAIDVPGKKFNYQSGNSQLLGYILEKATGKSVSVYTQEKIWKVIGAGNDAYWSMDTDAGDEKSFCCLYATALDFARIGLLINQNGKWKSKQVVPEWYMKEMAVPTNITTDEGLPNFRYGLHIWTYPYMNQMISYCRGIKGQYIISIPKENIVIVRLGMKRMDNFVIPESRQNDMKYVNKNKQNVGHPADFFEYIRIGREIAFGK